eukprot:RCo053171
MCAKPSLCSLDNFSTVNDSFEGSQPCFRASTPPSRLFWFPWPCYAFHLFYRATGSVMCTSLYASQHLLHRPFVGMLSISCALSHSLTAVLLFSGDWGATPPPLFLHQLSLCAFFTK